MNTKTEVRGWYVVDHNNDDKRLRGPYASEDAAAAVRHEMELGGDEYDKCNLWVVPEGRVKP